MWISGFLFLIAPWIHYFTHEGTFLLAISAILLGCGTFVIYPICVSHVNDQLEDAERTNASGMLILLQSIGLIVGPIIISAIMQSFGSIWFVLSYSLVSGCFLLFSFKQIATKAINYVNITPTDPIPVAPTHAFNKLTQDDTIIDKAKGILTSKH